jgi:uncharacterized membrane protein YgcG
MSETCLERWMQKPHFTCPRCDATSWNPHDIANRYCGRCHIFVAPTITLREAAPRDPIGVARARKRAEESLAPRRKADDDDSGASIFFPSAPPTAPDDPPAAAPDIDPGGGSSGGGGASGDW